MKCTYHVGEKVVYPGHGVGLIESIFSRSIGDESHDFYAITLLDSKATKIMVPVAQAELVGLRKVVDRKCVDQVFQILKQRDCKIDRQTWNRRFREYSQKLKTGSLFEIAEVLRDLSILSSDKELSFGERKMLESAQHLLVSEVAIVKARTEEKVIGEIQAIFA